MATAENSEGTIPPLTETDRRQIRIISHSMLFYWWPVWAAGFLLALITFFDGHQMAIVPHGTQLGRVIRGTVELDEPQGGRKPVDVENRTILVAPADRMIVDTPHLYMAQSRNLGVLFGTLIVL